MHLGGRCKSEQRKDIPRGHCQVQFIAERIRFLSLRSNFQHLRVPGVARWHAMHLFMPRDIRGVIGDLIDRDDVVGAGGLY